MKLPFQRRLVPLAGLVLAGGLGLGACQRVLPVRTLPAWVRGVYIPMVGNETFEPGLEELATRLTQEEFLANGQLRIVRKAEADLQLVAIIKDYFIRIDRTDSDDIPEIEELTILTGLKLYDPMNPEVPLADLGQIETIMLYNSDPRSIGYTPEPDLKERALRLLARQIVNRTIYGFPTSLRNLPPGVEIPTVQEPPLSPRRGPFRTESQIFR